MIPEEFYPTARTVFEDLAEGLKDRLEKMHGGVSPQNFMRMALSPNLAEAEAIVSAFARSEWFKNISETLPHIVTWYEPYYPFEKFFGEFAPFSEGAIIEDSSKNIESIALSFPIRRWESTIRFAASTDQEINGHLRSLVDQCRARLGREFSRLPIDEESFFAQEGMANSFIYLVPESASQGSLAVKRHEIAIRQSRGDVEGVCRFPAEFSDALSWLGDRGIKTGPGDYIVPFTPFHVFNVDGFMVVDSNHVLKAVVGMIDIFATGNAKLELVTEVFVRMFGLPGINRASNRTATSRRKYPVFVSSESSVNPMRPVTDPGWIGGATNVSATELRAMTLLYWKDIKPGMTKSDIEAMVKDWRRDG